MSSLTISRNKHWRYISAFHGPWLQLPHEILETLAHSNYLSPRPRQTDPAVLFDLLKVRKLVDEAADLAVRAQNGTASSALHTENGLPGAALGFNTRGGAGSNAKLSTERKYRMREVATQKLSQAYRLDEIAASVATMQSASALDSVASFVLQRAPQNTDAQYVHFFHEKIPSRMMAQYTPLDPLNSIIAREPSHASPYRTRALTRIFKEDHVGAAQDLTEALLLCRNEQAKHIAGKNQLITQKQALEDAERRKMWTKDWMLENRVLEEDQPKGLEMQLLFQRGNQYLTIALQHVKKALEAFKNARRLQQQREAKADMNGNSKENEQAAALTSSEEQEAYKRGLEAREFVRKYAKRALRDYTSFFSHLDYAVATDPHLRDIFDVGRVPGDDEDVTSSPISSTSSTSQALVTRPGRSNPSSNTDTGNLDAREPFIKLHDMAAMLSSKPPDNIPPFPPKNIGDTMQNGSSSPDGNSGVQHSHEMITYHPLLPETLHSFLLTHCLLQTAPTTLHRIANNAARLTRLGDGYPFFLSARSPARADWSEILRLAKNWIGLGSTWDQLCRTDVSHNGQSFTRTQGSSNNDIISKASGMRRKRPADETPKQKRDRIHKEAVIEALADERVVDDESFQKAVKAREERALKENGLDNGSSLMKAENTNGASTNGTVTASVNGAKENGDVTEDAAKGETGVTNGLASQNPSEPFDRSHGSNSPSSAVAKDEEYLIGTERAASIAQWVLDAPINPQPLDGATKPKRKKKPVKRTPLSQQSSDLSTMTETTLPD